jgi:hypothetical protein
MADALEAWRWQCEEGSSLWRSPQTTRSKVGQACLGVVSSARCVELRQKRGQQAQLGREGAGRCRSKLGQRLRRSQLRS